MKDFIFELIISILILSSGILIGIHYNKNNTLINQQAEEYQKCIAKLPRNQDCTLTGFVFTVTTKQD